MSRVWVPCKIGEGMFPGEASIFLVTSDGRELSMFIQENSSNFLRDGSVDSGWISGFTLIPSKDGHSVYVRLCKETLEGGRYAYFQEYTLRAADEDME
jgi:hypothetical protein